MLQEAIIVAKFDGKYIDECLKALGNKYPVFVIDTSEGGHPSGAFIRAYREINAKHYLFIQDSMFAITDDVMKPFRDLMPETGAVAWGRFHYCYDSSQQEDWVRAQYENPEPQWGIFGPTFYTSRKSMQILDRKGLFPENPKDKEQAQGTERAWAWAFKQGGMPVVSMDMWDKSKMERGDYPVFKKIWGGRT